MDDNFDDAIGTIIARHDTEVAQGNWRLARRIWNMLLWAFDAEKKFTD